MNLLWYAIFTDYLPILLKGNSNIEENNLQTHAKKKILSIYPQNEANLAVGSRTSDLHANDKADL